jgi:hypothetical protein
MGKEEHETTTATGTHSLHDESIEKWIETNKLCRIPKHD